MAPLFMKNWYANPENLKSMGSPRSSLIHFACIGVAQAAAARTVYGEQHQCRQNGSNLI